MKGIFRNNASVAIALAAGLSGGWAVVAQDQDQTNAKPPTKRELAKKQRALEKELASAWKKWMEEDVSYLITDEEKVAFKRLKTDEERQQFVEQFWLRRDPTPDTEENEFKEEHYRRIAYANDHYASGIPGWKDGSRQNLYQIRRAGRN